MGPLVSQRGVLMALSLPLLSGSRFLRWADGWVSVPAAGGRGERSNRGRGMRSLPEVPSSSRPGKKDQSDEKGRLLLGLRLRLSLKEDKRVSEVWNFENTNTTFRNLNALDLGWDL